MMRGKAVVSVVLSVALPACASSRPALPLGGRTVELRPAEPKGKDVEGELLAVGPQQLVVLTKEGVRGVPPREVKEARVRRHGLGPGKVLAWVVAGAVATGGALAAACASAEGGNCGAVFGLTVGLWALIGGPAAASLAKSSEHRVGGPDFAGLRPYARFPQGLPEGLDLASLGLRLSPCGDPSNGTGSDKPHTAADGRRCR